MEAFDSRGALRYASKYVAGVAFGDRRILSAVGEKIELYAWDYKADADSTLTLSPDDFLRRFALHILPPYVNRVRCAGLYYGRTRAEKLALCRKLLAEQAAETGPTITTQSAALSAATTPLEPSSDELAQMRADAWTLERQQRNAEWMPHPSQSQHLLWCKT